MAPRIPGRPKAADIPDLDVLKACALYSDAGRPHPGEGFQEFPQKVVAAKLDKLVGRGLVTPHLKITPAGREALAETQETTHG